VVPRSVVLFVEGVWQVFSFYSQMLRRKKFASKGKFRGNKYVRANKETGVPEKRQPRCDQSSESDCVKHNLSAWNKKIHLTSVNDEIKVGENNFYKSESNFTHDGNIVVSINLLCAFIGKNTNCKHCGGSISLFDKPSNRRGIVSNLVIKCCKCDHTADMMTSNITRSRLCDNNIPLVCGLR
jgi:hypothetical protein